MTWKKIQYKKLQQVSTNIPVPITQPTPSAKKKKNQQCQRTIRKIKQFFKTSRKTKSINIQQKGKSMNSPDTVIIMDIIPSAEINAAYKNQRNKCVKIRKKEF